MEREAPLSPPTARCAKCDTPVIMASGKLPRDWVECDGEAYCPDCDPPASRRASKQRLRTVETRVRHTRIGRTSSSYSGCRIYHEHQAGFVGLRIHGGASPPKGKRDDPVHFMLDARGVDELVRHLCDIRKDMPNG